MDKTELKNLRLKWKISQAELAEITGVKVGTVQSWEQGKRNISESASKLLSVYLEKQNKKEINSADAFNEIEKVNLQLSEILHHQKLQANEITRLRLQLDQLITTIKFKNN